MKHLERAIPSYYPHELYAETSNSAEPAVYRGTRQLFRLTRNCPEGCNGLLREVRFGEDVVNTKQDIAGSDFEAVLRELEPEINVPYLAGKVIEGEKESFLLRFDTEFSQQMIPSGEERYVVIVFSAAGETLGWRTVKPEELPPMYLLRLKSSRTFVSRG